MMRSNRNGALCKETRDWGIEHRVRSQESEVRDQSTEDRLFCIFNFETGNPPEGWESKGQFQNAK